MHKKQERIKDFGKRTVLFWRENKKQQRFIKMSLNPSEMKNSNNDRRIKLQFEVEMFLRNVEHIVPKNIPAVKFSAIANTSWSLEHLFKQIYRNCSTRKKILLFLWIFSVLYVLILEICLNLFIHEYFSWLHVCCKASVEILWLQQLQKSGNENYVDSRPYKLDPI